MYMQLKFFYERCEVLYSAMTWDQMVMGHDGGRKCPTKRRTHASTVIYGILYHTICFNFIVEKKEGIGIAIYKLYSVTNSLHNYKHERYTILSLSLISMKCIELSIFNFKKWSLHLFNVTLDTSNSFMSCQTVDLLFFEPVLHKKYRSARH